MRYRSNIIYYLMASSLYTGRIQLATCTYLRLTVVHQCNIGKQECPGQESGVYSILVTTRLPRAAPRWREYVHTHTYILWWACLREKSGRAKAQLARPAPAALENCGNSSHAWSMVVYSACFLIAGCWMGLWDKLLYIMFVHVQIFISYILRLL